MKLENINRGDRKRSPLFFLSLHTDTIHYTYTMSTSSYYTFSLSLLCLLVYLLILLISLYFLYLVHTYLSLLFRPLLYLHFIPFYCQIRIIQILISYNYLFFILVSMLSNLFFSTSFSSFFLLMLYYKFSLFLYTNCQ